MNSISVLFLVLLAIHASIQTCSIDEPKLLNLYQNETLIIDSRTLKFIYPKSQEKEAEILIEDGSEVLFSCAGFDLQHGKELSVDDKTIIAICNNDKFEVNGTTFKAEDIDCSSEYLETAEGTDEKCADNKGVIININYQIAAVNKSVNLYRVCFDPVSKNVYYSQFTTPENPNLGFSGYFARYMNPDEPLYNMDIEQVHELYSTAAAIVNQLLGLPADSHKYFKATDNALAYIIEEKLTDYFFFYYKTQQTSTYRYINTVPSFDPYVNRTLSNWINMRQGLRNLILKEKIQFEIYTGTYGVATLPHEETNEDVELYLYSNATIKILPIPKLLWKLVYDKANKSAVVFISVNNAWFLKDDDKICKDVSGDYGYENFGNWKRSEIQLLYSYTCTYEDFKKVVTFAPDLDVESVLAHKSSAKKQVISLLLIALSVLLLKY